MFNHILIATDGSELAGKAIATGLNLAKSHEARVTFVVVTEPRTLLVPDQNLASPVVDERDVKLAATAQAILANARAEAGKLRVKCEVVHVSNEFPAEGILSEAKRKGCDVIVMAS